MPNKNNTGTEIVKVKVDGETFFKERERIFKKYNRSITEVDLFARMIMRKFKAKSIKYVNDCIDLYLREKYCIFPGV